MLNHTTSTSDDINQEFTETQLTQSSVNETESNDLIATEDQDYEPLVIPQVAPKESPHLIRYVYITEGGKVLISSTVESIPFAAAFVRLVLENGIITSKPKLLAIAMGGIVSNAACGIGINYKSNVLATRDLFKFLRQLFSKNAEPSRYSRKVRVFAGLLGVPMSYFTIVGAIGLLYDGTKDVLSLAEGIPLDVRLTSAVTTLLLGGFSASTTLGTECKSLIDALLNLFDGAEKKLQDLFTFIRKTVLNIPNLPADVKNAFIKLDVSNLSKAELLERLSQLIKSLPYMLANTGITGVIIINIVIIPAVYAVLASITIGSEFSYGAGECLVDMAKALRIPDRIAEVLYGQSYPSLFSGIGANLALYGYYVDYGLMRTFMWTENAFSRFLYECKYITLAAYGKFTGSMVDMDSQSLVARLHRPSLMEIKGFILNNVTATPRRSAYAIMSFLVFLQIIMSACLAAKTLPELTDIWIIIAACISAEMFATIFGDAEQLKNLVDEGFDKIGIEKIGRKQDELVLAEEKKDKEEPSLAEVTVQNVIKLRTKYCFNTYGFFGANTTKGLKKDLEQKSLEFDEETPINQFYGYGTN